MRGLTRIYAKVGLRVSGVEMQKFEPDKKARFSFTYILRLLTKLWVHYLSVTHKYQMRVARGNQEKKCGAYGEKICKFPLPTHPVSLLLTWKIRCIFCRPTLFQNSFFKTRTNKIQPYLKDRMRKLSQMRRFHPNL